MPLVPLLRRARVLGAQVRLRTAEQKRPWLLHLRVAGIERGLVLWLLRDADCFALFSASQGLDLPQALSPRAPRRSGPRQPSKQRIDLCASQRRLPTSITTQQPNTRAAG